jgi:murein DD-endopeptidase MepM/ murein hydrolase activator NlpD
MDNIIIINPPICSVFITPNTPGSKIPSHGTAKYGEMYAIDFVVINKDTLSRKPYKSSFMHYLFQGLDLSDFYGWGEKVYAPVEGEVVKITDDIEERNPVNVFKDVGNAIKVTKKFESGTLNSNELTGNCVIIKYGEKKYCLLAHLKKDSIQVKEGQKVDCNDIIGELGHSGNSTMPHLHMQFMDSLDSNTANGIPFVINSFLVYEKGTWIKKIKAVPKKEDIIRTDE